jgi:hypothetical protein
MRVDVAGLDVKTAAREFLAKFVGPRENLGLKKRADAARSALPPEKADYLYFLVLRRRGQPPDRSSRQPDAVHRPVRPRDHIVSADDKMIDPVSRAFRFDIIHFKNSLPLFRQFQRFQSFQLSN